MASRKQNEEEQQGNHLHRGHSEGDDVSSSCPYSSPAALPGLPDELAILCIARVPSMAQIRGVCRTWRGIVASSVLFQHVRRDVGLAPPQWLYALLKAPSSSSCFEWHAYDPVARSWHRLPPLPIRIPFHLSSPSLIGHTYSVQCAASPTRLFMVAACRLGGTTSSTSGSIHSSSQYGRLREGDGLGVADLQEDADVDDDFGGLQREDEQRESETQIRTHLSLGAQMRTALEPALPCPLIFNTVTKTWSFASAPFYGPRCWCATGLTSHGKLCIASGCGKVWDLAVSKSAELYDPEDDTWTRIEGLRSSKFSGEAITAVNYEGKLHMVSGRGVFNKVGVVYDAEMDKWVNMPNGMRAGWTGSCVVVDGTLLALDENMGRLRLYQSDGDMWRTFVEHPMLKGLEQVVAAPGTKICGLKRGLHGSCGDSCHTCEGDFVRIIHFSPSPADLMDCHISCQLSFIDIALPAPNLTIVALQLLSLFF